MIDSRVIPMVAIAMVTGMSAASAANCDDLKKQMDNQRTGTIQAAGEAIKKAVYVPPEAIQAASCIGNIMNPTLTVDAAFTKSLTDALMKEACKIATDTINDSISSVLGSAGASSTGGLFGVGVGIRNGPGGIQTRTTDTSGRAASQVGSAAQQGTAPIAGAAGDVWGSIK